MTIKLEQLQQYWRRLPGRRFILLCLCFILGLKGIDLIFPIHAENKRFAQVVTDQHQRPMRAFADTQGVWRYQVSIQDVSPLYIQALLTYEDRWFWYHPGVNPLSLARATWQNIRNQTVISGGSTITMQVARMLYPYPRSYGGKFKQILRALQLEWHLSKTEILELYLNHAPFGGTREGVQAASYHYFGKSAKQLTHAEAALLAVLPQAPSRLRPDRYPDRAEKARNKVLARLQRFQVWSQDEVTPAKQEPIFVFTGMFSQTANLLSERLKRQYPNQPVIQTTIDGDLQRQIASYSKGYVQKLPKYSSAAVLVVENQTGAVRAYLGSADYGNITRFGHIDMVQASRSPGSTLKPFLYGLALEEGLLHSHSLLADVPRVGQAYQPDNFEGKFQGPVTMAAALQRSLNVPAVDALERLGPKFFAARLQQAGMQLHFPPFAKPSLAMILGGVGTSLEDLVQTYTAFTHDGKALALRFTPEEPMVERPFMSAGSAWIIRKILTGASQSASLLSGRLSAHRRSFGWKTGTSYGFRDAWAVGVGPEYTIGVWVGRPDGSPMPGYYGRNTATPLLRSIAEFLDQFDGALPEAPKSVKRQSICWPLGTLASMNKPQWCQQSHDAWIFDGNVPPTYHRFEAEHDAALLTAFIQDKQTKRRVNLSCTHGDVESHTAALWPQRLEPWLPSRFRRAQLLPEWSLKCQNKSGAIRGIKIFGIEEGERYRRPPGQDDFPKIAMHGFGGSGDFHWYVNGKYRSTTQGEQPFYLQPGHTGVQQIVLSDDSGHIEKVTVYFEQ
ncbi:penicillin-binding protein 1C [Algicola sagamiensis]|uniref:penicillin-binding protein 1C n=1 Tax=Algicola sagamiensis TaxID=163869 RepID=UPI000476AF2C|nr:penicillin-binding protein 1C [Algicola sagamiensis]